MPIRSHGTTKMRHIIQTVTWQQENNWRKATSSFSQHVNSRSMKHTIRTVLKQGPDTIGSTTKNESTTTITEAPLRTPSQLQLKRMLNFLYDHVWNLAHHDVRYIHVIWICKTASLVVNAVLNLENKDDFIYNLKYLTRVNSWIRTNGRTDGQYILTFKSYLGLCIFIIPTSVNNICSWFMNIKQKRQTIFFKPLKR